MREDSREDSRENSREDFREASAIHRAPIEQQQKFRAERFRDADRQTERFVEGMKDSPFFHSQEIAQVRIDGRPKGRVVLGRGRRAPRLPLQRHGDLRRLGRRLRPGRARRDR
ncbi:hypothetical protein [Embleya sp. NPDC059259]|uniref:hypothetical protein n=1 Tax=unclassified Embleya TaxID=2699296 RepID=UPI0036CE2D85